jgi:hypothetical protein
MTASSYLRHLVAAILATAALPVAGAGIEPYRSIGILHKDYLEAHLQATRGGCARGQHRVIAFLVLGPWMWTGCWSIRPDGAVVVELEDGSRIVREQRDVIWCARRARTCTDLHLMRVR